MSSVKRPGSDNTMHAALVSWTSHIGSPQIFNMEKGRYLRISMMSFKNAATIMMYKYPNIKTRRSMVDQPDFESCYASIRRATRL